MHFDVGWVALKKKKLILFFIVTKRKKNTTNYYNLNKHYQIITQFAYPNTFEI